MLGVHPVSCWELAMLVTHRRLRLRETVIGWVDAALGRPKIDLIPFTPTAAVRAAGLGDGFPNDPADRFIAAAALELDAPLVTADQAIAHWGGVDIIW
jgi:PIN domain nuclease of toxin-antitoxin system